MNALLINVPTKNSYETSEPLGLYYIAAACQEIGHSVEILDGVIKRLSIAEVADRVEKKDYALVGISVPFQLYLPDAIELVKVLRGRGIDSHITFGGVSPSLCYQELLLEVPEIDSVVVGEGEYAFKQLFSSIKQGTDWRKTPGLAYRDAACISVNPCALIKDLNTLPFPRIVDYREHPYDAYRILVASSRGCHASCTFCSVHSFYEQGEGQKWRSRSPENIVRELKLLSEQGVKTFRFADDNFFGPGASGIKRAHEIAALILAEGLELEYSFEARSTEMKEEVLSPLIESGLRKVFVGIESVNPATLEFFRKGARVEENLKAIETLNAMGIDYEIGYILFQPQSTLEELFESLRFLRNLPNLKPFHLSKLAVYHGTPIQKSMAAKGLLSGGYLWYDYEFADPRVGDIWKTTQDITDLLTKAYLALMEVNELINRLETRRNKADLVRALEKSSYQLFKKFDGLMRRSVDLLSRSVDEKMHGKSGLVSSLGLPLLELEVENLSDAIARLMAQVAKPAHATTSLS